MKIIVLKGAKNSGKTTTMNIVCHLLRSEGAYVEGEEKKHIKIGVYDDFECVVEYKGKKVAIYSMGDYVGPVKEAINAYKGKCDILVCTSRYGKLINSLRPEFEKHEPMYIDKTKNIKCMWLANMHDAERVIEKTHHIINESKEEL